MTADMPPVLYARDIIEDLVDADDCRYDHHGYCQAHGWMDDSPCPHKRGKAWLAAPPPEFNRDAVADAIAREWAHRRGAADTCLTCQRIEQLADAIAAWADGGAS